MKLRILITAVLFSLPLAPTPQPANAAQSETIAIDINKLRSRITNLPGSALLSAVHAGAPARCLELLAEFQRSEPRRPAPWIAYRAQAACAVAGGDFDAARAFAEEGLNLRGSDSDLLVLKAVAIKSAGSDPIGSEPAMDEVRVEALTEALVFDRFEAASRLETLIFLGETLNRIGQGARAAALLERWVKREPGVQSLIVESYIKAGNRPRALELSTEYLADKPKDRALTRARAKALLLATDRVLARNDFQDALTLLSDLSSPLSAQEISLKAQTFMKLGQPQDALEVLEAGVGPEIEALREQAIDEINSQR